MVAALVCTGAYTARPFATATVAVAALVALGGLGTRRWTVLAVGLAVVASAFGANALAGLLPPRPEVVKQRWATLLTDPARLDGGSVGADVRLGRRHVRIYARNDAGEALAFRLAGEKVQLSGALRGLQGVQRERLISRHIASQMSVDAVHAWKRGNVVASAANAYRRIVERGEHALPESLRPLFGGMVLGDDRGESAELQDAFKAAGLTHLMVVSGQNVAFCLLLATPLIRRGGLRWRLGCTLAALFCFGVLTRWEPSVLRAEAMAAVAAAGSFVGRPVPASRLLALAVTGCVLVDPLLVRSVGFRLSVAACSGLVVLTKRLQDRGVPLLLAASIAAQVGAAVVLLPTFGSMPLASLPANVLAVPIAGPVMMWGLVMGPVAGLLPPLAWLLHLPDRAMLWWVAGVARWAAGLPLAPLGPTAAVILVTGCVIASWLWHSERTRVVGGAVAGAVAVFVAFAAVMAPGATAAAPLGPGVSLWVVEGRSVLVVGGRVSSAVTQELRRRRVQRLDVFVVTRPGSSAADAAWPIVQAFRPRAVLAPEHHQIAGAKTARLGAVARAGPLQVRITDAGPPLEVEVTSQT